MRGIDKKNFFYEPSCQSYLLAFFRLLAGPFQVGNHFQTPQISARGAALQAFLGLLYAVMFRLMWNTDGVLT